MVVPFCPLGTPARAGHGADDPGHPSPLTPEPALRRTVPFVLMPLALLAACADDVPTALDPDASAKRAPVAAAAAVSVVMSGLDSPRGLDWGPEGALYVVEAGDKTVRGPCAVIPRGQKCYTGSGAISRLWKGRQERIASGLPSVYNPPPVDDITGPHDIDFQGRGNGYVTVGWGGPPAARAGLGELGALFGTLIRVRPSGGWSVEAGISDYEAAHNPDGGPVDSNPYGVLAEPGRQFVTDAGGNSLVQVDADGTISLVAVFGRVPAGAPTSEAVPTEVKRGPDGALYVSTLSGVPFTAGNAAIYRVVPGEAPVVYAGGFKTITDFDIAPDGTLWVVQYASAPTFFGGPGLLIRVAPGGTRTVVNAALTNPTGVLVGPDGAIYVSNRGNVPDVGEVLRIVP
jgi:hypothetical protein